MHRAKSIANYFLEKARTSNEELNLIKLIKLVYLAHGWHLALNNRKPLLNEYIEALDFGVTIRSLFDEFKSYGMNPIKTTTFDTVLDSNKKVVSIPVPLPCDNYVIKLLNRVWEVYRKYSWTQLVNITLQEGSPWRSTRDKNPDICNPQISNDDIYEWFSKKLVNKKDIK